MIIRLMTLPLLALLSLHASSVSALTAADFSSICDSAKANCSENAVVQAYVGGALDLLATLDEHTDYLDKVYCKDPRELFDMASIVRFMQAHSKDDAERNAMLVLIRYFEVFGGCEPRE